MFIMEISICLLSILLPLLLILALKLLLQYTKPSNLPPGPPSLPIIGHLHYLKHPLIHRTFLELSQKYGPVMSLRFGSRLVVVVSSWTAAEECFTTNDYVLANRPEGFVLGKTTSYNYMSVMAAPYGDHWRRMRRFSAHQLFSTKSLDAFAKLRKEEIERLINKLGRDSMDGFVSVELRPMFQELPFGILMRVLLGKKYYGEDLTDVEEAKQFHEIISDIIKISVLTYPGDFMPVLRWFDYTGYEKSLVRIMQRTDKFLQGMLDQRRQKMSMLETTDDGDDTTVVDNLLSLQQLEPQNYTDEIIKAQILIFLIAGTDAVSIPLEWAVSNLIDRPDVLEKAKAEINSQTGPDRVINESDLPHLGYLDNIISETLRLFPPVPLLMPHFSSDQCFIGGYRIPRKTMIMVNAWAIQRDPSNWERPTRFEPERFENRKICDGQINMMPFGLGRRGCPGAPLAHRVLGLTLGLLIQCFDWKGKGDNDMMETAQGVTMPRAKPLVANIRARSVIKFL